MIFILFIVIEVVISYKCLTISNYHIKSDKIKEDGTGLLCFGQS